MTTPRPALDAAGRLIDVSLAERRNLVMRNPTPGATFETSRTLVCAYQMILPGEHAPSHRHSSHALRVIIDSKGSYSTVNGEKTPMETGDVVLTPGWCWHGHGHDGDEPAYWFDGLDVPLTHLLEPMFFEEHPEKHEKVERVAQTSPFRFTRDDIARKLDAARADNEGFHGPRITLAAPDMPPMGLTVERLRVRRKDAALPHHRQHDLPCDGGGRRNHGRRAALLLEARRHHRRAGLERHQPPRNVGRAMVRDVRRAAAAVLGLLPVRGDGVAATYSRREPGAHAPVFPRAVEAERTEQYLAGALDLGRAEMLHRGVAAALRLGCAPGSASRRCTSGRSTP